MRLIDADALSKHIYNDIPIKNFGGSKKIMGFVRELIDNAPTIEAEPVKHGKWVLGGVCSECGYCALSFNDEVVIESEYCPSCDAKMDLED